MARVIVDLTSCICRYYMCRASNVLQSQQVTVHLTLDYDFMVDVRNYSILTGFIVAVLFTLATLIGELLSSYSNNSIHVMLRVPFVYIHASPSSSFGLSVSRRLFHKGSDE